MATPTEAELGAWVTARLPSADHRGVTVERVSDGAVRLRLVFREELLGTDRWGAGDMAVFSGPALMGLADTAMYACALAAVGPDAVPVIVTLTTTFLRPARAADLVAEARIVRLGRRLAYLEAYLRSDGEADPAAHVTATYALRGSGADERRPVR